MLSGAALYGISVATSRRPQTVYIKRIQKGKAIKGNPHYPARFGFGLLISRAEDRDVAAKAIGAPSASSASVREKIPRLLRGDHPTIHETANRDRATGRGTHAAAEPGLARDWKTPNPVPPVRGTSIRSIYVAARRLARYTLATSSDSELEPLAPAYDEVTPVALREHIRVWSSDNFFIFALFPRHSRSR